MEPINTDSMLSTALFGVRSAASRAAEVRFSPVQAGIFPNLEPNFRFGSGKCPNVEPNFRFRFAKVRFRFKNGSNSVRTPFLFKMPDRIIRHYVSKKISKILVL